MSWAVGYNEDLQRDIGYGVPAICDHPDCNEEIDRGFDFVCGEPPYGGEEGCGLHFCHKHKSAGVCDRCYAGLEPFTKKPDTQEWIQHKMSDPSWAEWRREQGFETAGG